MSTANSTLPYNFKTLFVGISSTPNPSSLLATAKLKNKCQFLGNQTLTIYRTNLQQQRRCRNLTVNSCDIFGLPLPSDLCPDSWKFWILGLLISLSLPSVLTIWRSSVKPKFDAVEETVKQVVDTVEKVAEEVENVAEEIGDHLPEGGKIKAAVKFVENVAEEAVNDARLAEEFLDQVEEVEEKLDSYIEARAKGNTEDEEANATT